MQANFEQIKSMFDDYNCSSQNVFNSIFHNICDEDQYYPDYNSSNNNNITIIEENENKQEMNEVFRKSFKKVFSIEEKCDMDKPIADENLYFIKKPETIKVGRKRGRLSKNTLPQYELKHSKLSKDNLIQKITRNFIITCLNYINKIYQESFTGKECQLLLRSIDPKIYNVYSNKKIYEFFNKTLGEVFSADVSKRNSNFLSTHSKDYNKKRIESLIKENKEKNVIEKLNLTMKEMYEKYLNNELGEFNLENDLTKIEKKEGEDYKKAYEEKALNLIDIINKKGEKIKNK